VPRLTANDDLLDEFSDILRAAVPDPSLRERILSICDLDDVARIAYCHSTIAEMKKHNEEPKFIRFFTMLSEPAFANAARDILIETRGDKSVL
jgi:hypothetical protein